MNHFPNIFYQILNYQTARVKFWILIVDLIYASIKSIKLKVLKTQNWWVEVEMNETKIQYDISTPSILRQDSIDIIQNKHQFADICLYTLLMLMHDTRG